MVFVVDVTLGLDLAPAAETDDLAATVDYGTLAQAIHDAVANDPAYDRAIYEAARTIDTAKRHALLRDAETRLLEAAPILPIYINTHVYLLNPAVRGWHSTLLDRHPLKAVSLAP